MKRFYTKSGKVILSIICIIFSLIFSASFLACVLLENWGLYSSTRQEFKQTLRDMAGGDYSVWILSEANSGFQSEKLSQMNCYYGVIEGNDVSNIDLNNTSNYIYNNFNGTKVPENAYVDRYGIDKDTHFTLSDKFLAPSRPNYIDSYNYDSQIYRTYSIDGIGYDIVGQQAYIYANNQFYPIDSGYYNYSNENSDEGTPNTNKIYSKIWSNSLSSASQDINEEDETYYVVEEYEESDINAEDETVDYLPSEAAENAQSESAQIEEDKLYIGGRAFNPLSTEVDGYSMELFGDDGSEGVLSLDNVADLTDIHAELKDLDEYVSMDNISTIGTYEDNPDMQYYTVVCFPNEEKLSSANHTNDFYAQADSVANKALSVKYVLPVIALIAFIIAIGSLILFMCAAGHRKESDEIVAGFIEKIPTDVALIGTFFAEFIVLVCLYESVNDIGSLDWFFSIFISVVVFVAGMIIGLLWSSNFVVNIKLHKLWSNSILAKICGAVAKWFKTFWQEVRQISATVKWTKRIWALFIVISVIEFFAIFITGADGIFLFWVLEKIAFAIILRRILRSYARIKATAMELAAGNTESQVELNGMPLFLEEHARAMNDIQLGINVALAERTKSERMKTELITNVSHDIKTPLTSIINYVDLLEKEEIDNSKAKEYLEVLDRQSKRLKKLIEDLIEASKISSGNVKFNIEKINAVVLLNQSIGEFSDRLEANEITLVTSIASQDAYLQADNRYLWRVFDNLMSNIVKYAQPNTRAYVDLEEDESKLRFVFRNTSKEELNISAEELMERFVRGDKSRYTDGNGLGLSIAKSLTEAMGGTINLSIDGDLFKAILEFDKVV